MQVGDGFVDAGPVEHVLGPSIDAARHHAKEVLHGQRRARPVMGLHLWHRDQQVRAQSRVGEVERAETRELAGGAHARDVIQVEIHKDVFEARHGVEVSGRVRQVQRVAAVPRALGDAHTGGAHPAEGFQGGVDQQGMGIDAAFRLELDQIGLEHDVAAAYFEPMLFHHPAHGLIKALVINRRAHNGDDRRNDGPLLAAAGEERGRRRPGQPFASGECS